MKIEWEDLLEKIENGEQVEDEIKKITLHTLSSDTRATIKFGTSGWRGVIGNDYTLFNVQRVTRAIVRIYENIEEKLAEELGVKSFEAFKKLGVLVGHDTRFLGPTFAKGVAAVLQSHGVRVAYAGVATTPEFSAALAQGGFACAINLTPSHNPGNYGGYKYNPADGGPAGTDVTSKIEEALSGDEDFVFLSIDGIQMENFDILKSYRSFYEQSNILDFSFCKEFAHSGEIFLAVDSVYGATKGRLKYLLDSPEELAEIRVEDEPFFKGMEPEPSSKNMNLIQETLSSKSNPFTLGMIMDPDGDRVQFWDGESAIVMNDFGAIAYHYLAVKKEKDGDLAHSVATSSFADRIAKKLNRDVLQTKVGFKYFRPHLNGTDKSQALICFEESDGISAKGHTLEKDAHIGCLLAIEIMGRTQMTLTAYLKELRQEYGLCFNQRYGFKLDPEAGLKPSKVLFDIQAQFSPGDQIDTDAGKKIVQEIVTLDGLKMVFEDLSWFLIRPSGTEPKVRIYAESPNSREETEKLFQRAQKLYQEVSSAGVT